MNDNQKSRRKSQSGGSQTDSKLRLTSSQKQEIREAFNLFDLEGIGVIEIEQLKIPLRALGFEPTKDDMRKIRQQYDNEGKGVIDFSGFLSLMTLKMLEKESEEDICKAFQMFDCSNQGRITLNDLKKVAKIVGEKMTDEELQEMIDEADRNGDGVIDQVEFIRIMKRTNVI
ncbi:Centrin-1 [Cichlidogyrus casuarinus]|uniref:Centrin-1 n=1 Tax=Cichlidogyrus casuarinus TaxID=1844966 RepID=A0ABD2QB19_9PLAT